MKTLAIFAILALLTPANMEEITDLLPPDGTPSGWSRDGESATYGPSDIAFITETPGAYTNNGVVTAIEQAYTDGSNSLNVRIFELADSTDANIAFTEAAAGKEITQDLGNGTVLETSSILFTSDKYVIHVVTEATDSAMSQTVAAMAMTVDAYLLTQ